MNAKEYLTGIRRLEGKIETKRMQILSLWDMAQSITGTIKEVGVRSQGCADPMAETVSKIVDLESEIKADVERYVNMRLEAMQLINLMHNEQYISILYRRYINLEEWPEIAVAMNYTKQSVLNKHRDALIEFQKVLDWYKK